MRTLSEGEMKGFLSNLPDHFTERERIHAVVDHFFTCCILPDTPKDVGYQYSTNLLQFISLAKDQSSEGSPQ